MELVTDVRCFLGSLPAAITWTSKIITCRHHDKHIYILQCNTFGLPLHIIFYSESAYPLVDGYRSLEMCMFLYFLFFIHISLNVKRNHLLLRRQPLAWPVHNSSKLLGFCSAIQIYIYIYISSMLLIQLQKYTEMFSQTLQIKCVCFTTFLKCCTISFNCYFIHNINI